MIAKNLSRHLRQRQCSSSGPRYPRPEYVADQQPQTTRHLSAGVILSAQRSAVDVYNSYVVFAIYIYGLDSVGSLRNVSNVTDWTGMRGPSLGLTATFTTDCESIGTGDTTWMVTLCFAEFGLGTPGTPSTAMLRDELNSACKKKCHPNLQPIGTWRYQV